MARTKKTTPVKTEPVPASTVAAEPLETSPEVAPSDAWTCPVDGTAHPAALDRCPVCGNPW